MGQSDKNPVSTLLNKDLKQNLTHISPLDYSILIDWTSTFPILGVSGVIFQSDFILD